MVALSNGDVLEIESGVLLLHKCVVAALFRGLGAPVVKSAELFLPLVHPDPPRSSAVVLLGAGVGPVPRKQVVLPKPTRSMALEVGQAPLSGVVELTSATFAAVADMLMVPVASGVGALRRTGLLRQLPEPGSIVQHGEFR
jgi:hypothetical protein